MLPMVMPTAAVNSAFPSHLTIANQASLQPLHFTPSNLLSILFSLECYLSLTTKFWAYGCEKGNVFVTVSTGFFRG